MASLSSTELPHCPSSLSSLLIIQNGEQLHKNNQKWSRGVFFGMLNASVAGALPWIPLESLQHSPYPLAGLQHGKSLAVDLWLIRVVQKNGTKLVTP